VGLKKATLPGKMEGLQVREEGCQTNKQKVNRGAGTYISPRGTGENKNSVNVRWQAGETRQSHQKLRWKKNGRWREGETHQRGKGVVNESTAVVTCDRGSRNVSVASLTGRNKPGPRGAAKGGNFVKTVLRRIKKREDDAASPGGIIRKQNRGQGSCGEKRTPYCAAAN